MTWLSFLNYWILQWFFVRLFRITDDEKPGWQEFKLGGWIEPLSGWTDRYKWHGKILYGKKIK